MNIKHLFFYMLLITFSSCSKPGYEKPLQNGFRQILTVPGRI